jgi:hypothetical protein
VRTRYRWRVRAYHGPLRKIKGLRWLGSKMADLSGTTDTVDQACEVTKAHVAVMGEMAPGACFSVQVHSYVHNYSSHGGID